MPDPALCARRLGRTSKLKDMTLKVRANTGGKDGLMEKLVRLMIILLFSTACYRAGPSWVVERNQYGRLDVRVTDQAALDALLQSKWAAMKSALRAGDTATAASYFTKDKVTIYKNMFDNFRIPYSQIYSYLGNIVWLRQSSVWVDYTLQANSLGVGGNCDFSTRTRQ